MTSVSRINFGGSSVNVTLFNSRKISLFWKILVGCGRDVSRAVARMSQLGGPKITSGTF